MRATYSIEEVVQSPLAMVGRSSPARQEEPVTVAAGCAGGRRRAATVAGELAERCAARGLDVDLVDRDLDKDVVER
ncbi:hypothetical protein [Streptomyces anulatus]|uniref:RapZ C-terminal domain-containing protein n=1 Tax=Streptomyces anulatus TaxID=1892 RepID=UPI00379B9B53